MPTEKEDRHDTEEQTPDPAELEGEEKEAYDRAVKAGVSPRTGDVKSSDTLRREAADRAEEEPEYGMGTPADEDEEKEDILDAPDEPVKDK